MQHRERDHSADGALDFSTERLPYRERAVNKPGIRQKPGRAVVEAPWLFPCVFQQGGTN